MFAIALYLLPPRRMDGFIMFGFIRTTILGGFLFLFPIVIGVTIIGKALEFINKLSAPLAGLLPIDSNGGLAVVTLLVLRKDNQFNRGGISRWHLKDL
jgi:hypothetical protein